MMIATCSLPGFTVSCDSMLVRVVEMAMAALWPACSVPDACDTLIAPIRLGGMEMDQVTGPPFAVIVNEAPSSGASTTVLGDTVSVPAAGGWDVAATGVADGDELDGSGARAPDAEWLDVAGRLPDGSGALGLAGPLADPPA